VFVMLALVGTCLLLMTLTLSSKVAAQGQASSRWRSGATIQSLPTASTIGAAAG